MKLSEALIKLQIFLFCDGSESNIFVKVLNQIQEEEWLCRLEEVPAEVQKRFKNIFKQKIQTGSSEINVDPKLRDLRNYFSDFLPIARIYSNISENI